MLKKYCVLLISGIMVSTFATAQKPAIQQAVDTSFTDYDALFNELDAFLDSIMAPRSFTLVSVGISSNYFDYESKSSALLQATKKITYAPSVSYFDKSGFSVSGAETVVNDGEKVNPFQLSISGGYDYIRNMHFITGVSYTRYITKKDLPFYTSPLKNQLYAYFSYRKCWIKPSVAVSYGWGNRTAYKQQEDKITSLQLALNGYTTVNTTESINDLNVITSLRHDFYWLNLFSKKDYVRLTPQIVFTGGTQKFGFNQTTNTYLLPQKTAVNILTNSDNVYLDNKMIFQPLSLAAFIKTEYAIGKMFFQPQLVIDYYFPAQDNNLSAGFVFNAGVIF